MRIATAPVPVTLRTLQCEIVARYDDMSGRLQLVGDFLLQHPNTVALNNMVAIAGEIGVSPSTLVRFADFLGFKGFSDLQKLYVRDLKGQVNGYRERVRQASAGGEIRQTGHQLLESFTGSQVMAIENMNNDIATDDFEKALDLMQSADTIYVTGTRRSFPVAYYFSYALMRADINGVLLDSVGGLHKNQIRRITDNDLLIAISYHPHSQETCESINAVSARNCKTLVLTDNSVHPCKGVITHALKYTEPEMMGMRSLSCSMHLAQCLVMGLIFRQEQP